MALEATNAARQQLEEERQHAASAVKAHAKSLDRVQRAAKEHLRARRETERQARADVDAAHRAKAAAEAQCQTLRLALEAVRRDSASTQQALQADLNQTREELAALKDRHDNEIARANQAEDTVKELQERLSAALATSPTPGKERQRKLSVSFPSDGSAPRLMRLSPVSRSSTSPVHSLVRSSD